jgi:hypothetical protein
MDTRLWTINGIRLETLKRPDLPNVARAIVGFHRGFCKVKPGFVRNVSYVEFTGDAFAVVVRGDDWDKIKPYIEDGTLAPPPEPLTNWAGTSIANIDQRDPEYYAVVLGVLQRLFTQEYPTSLL